MTSIFLNKVDVCECHFSPDLIPFIEWLLYRDAICGVFLQKKIQQVHITNIVIDEWFVEWSIDRAISRQMEMEKVYI